MAAAAFASVAEAAFASVADADADSDFEAAAVELEADAEEDELETAAAALAYGPQIFALAVAASVRRYVSMTYTSYVKYEVSIIIKTYWLGRQPRS